MSRAKEIGAAHAFSLIAQPMLIDGPLSVRLIDWPRLSEKLKVH